MITVKSTVIKTSQKTYNINQTTYNIKKRQITIINNGPS